MDDNFCTALILHLIVITSGRDNHAKQLSLRNLYIKSSRAIKHGRCLKDSGNLSQGISCLWIWKGFETMHGVAAVNLGKNRTREEQDTAVMCGRTWTPQSQQKPPYTESMHWCMEPETKTASQKKQEEEASNYDQIQRPEGEHRIKSKYDTFKGAIVHIISWRQE